MLPWCLPWWKLSGNRWRLSGNLNLTFLYIYIFRYRHTHIYIYISLSHMNSVSGLNMFEPTLAHANVHVVVLQGKILAKKAHDTSLGHEPFHLTRFSTSNP